MRGEFSIVCCPAAQRADALRVLHVGLPPDQQVGLVHALQAVNLQDDSAFQGLLLASTQDEMLGAAWAQLTPGSTAVIWLPDLTNPAAAGLMKALAHFLDEQKVTLAQFLANNDSAIAPDLLTAGEFRKLAKLAYLTVDSQMFPEDQPTSRLSFQPSASEEPERLGKLLQSTYEGSLDCPQLNGFRASEDVLEGYREQGTFAAELWFILQRDSRDVGALILTVHEDSGNWELVYMGLVPEARGTGLGSEILEFAMWQAKQGGAERLVLAVDEVNQPALDMYQRAGFVAWDYRTVYARLRPKP